jgi:hypothetical protein
MPFSASMGTVGFSVVPFIHQFISGFTGSQNGANGVNTMGPATSGSFFTAGVTQVRGTNLVITGSPGTISYSWSITGSGSVSGVFYSGLNTTGVGTQYINASSGSGSGSISVPIGTQSVTMIASCGTNSSASGNMTLT